MLDKQYTFLNYYSMLRCYFNQEEYNYCIQHMGPTNLYKTCKTMEEVAKKVRDSMNYQRLMKPQREPYDVRDSAKRS